MDLKQLPNDAAVLLLLLCSTSGAWSQTQTQEQRRIALTDKSNVPTGDVLKGLRKNCPNVSITNDGTKSDYTLEAVEKTGAGQHVSFNLTLFDSDGKAVYSTSTIFIGNAVKDVCHAINGSAKKKK